MLTRTRRRVVEEEVTEVVSHDFNIEAWRKVEQERRNRMKYERKRRHSFDPMWLKLCQLDVGVAQRLAKAGFYCDDGYTWCFSCGLCKPLYFWLKVRRSPETVHREESPGCKFITGQSDKSLNVLRRFQIFISNIFKQNEEIEQPDNNQTKLRSEDQQLESDTKRKQITENENSDEKQKENIKAISQHPLPSVAEPDKPEEVYKHETLKDRSQYQTKIDTGPSKSQIQPEGKKNEKFTKTNQKRQTEQRTGFGGDAEEISGTKRQASEKTDVIPSTSNPPDVPVISERNHAAPNAHQRLADVTRSSSSDITREKLTSRRDTRTSTSTTHRAFKMKSASESIKGKVVSVTTSRSRSSDVNREKSVNSRSHREHLTTYQELEMIEGSESIKEKTVRSTTSRSSDVKRNKSATRSRSLQEFITSEPRRDVAHAVSTKNAGITSPDDSDADRFKPSPARQECYTSEIPCSMVSSEKIFKTSVYS